MADNAISLLEELDAVDASNLLIDLKGFNAVKKEVTNISKRAAERKQAEARSVSQAAAYADDLHDEHMAGTEEAEPHEDVNQKLKNIQQQVKDQLDEDADAVEVEPPTFTTVIHPAQALPTLQLQQLHVLQPVLCLQQQLLGSEPASSEHASAAAAAAFYSLLIQQEQLVVCNDTDTAKAVFHAVWCGSSELAKAAYTKFLGWCGVTELQSGSETPHFNIDGIIAANSSMDSAVLCGAPALSSLQPPVSIQWLPSAEDFIEALTAMGCRMQAAGGVVSSASPAAKKHRARSSVAAPTPVSGTTCAQEVLYTDGNLSLLLQLLTHICKLGGEGGRLPLKLGSAAAVKQLALLLLALLLDARAAGSAAGRTAMADAVDALLGACSEAEWRRLEGQLLEALAPPGLGPSDRSTVLLLSHLPLTPRCVSLRQQGALQLLDKLLPGNRTQQQISTARSSRTARASAHDSLLLLLGKSPSKALVKALTPCTSGSGSQQQQQQAAMDVWTMLNILEAAHLVLWADVVGSGGSSVLPSAVRKWFYEWMKELERQLANQLKQAKLRSKLTYLRNAYEWSNQVKLATAAATADEDGVGYGDELL